MKKHHGSIPVISTADMILLLLCGTTMAYGGDFTYKFRLSNSAPYTKEAVIMKLDLVQTDHSKVILFNFAPKRVTITLFTVSI